METVLLAVVTIGYGAIALLCIVIACSKRAPSMPELTPAMREALTEQYVDGWHVIRQYVGSVEDFAALDARDWQQLGDELHDVAEWRRAKIRRFTLLFSAAKMAAEPPNPV